MYVCLLSANELDGGRSTLLPATTNNFIKTSESIQHLKGLALADIQGLCQLGFDEAKAAMFLAEERQGQEAFPSA